MHPFLYTEEFLRKLRQLFANALNCTDFTDDVMLRLMSLFSLSPKEAARYCLPVPFFQVGNHYLRYDGFFNIMSPPMGLLAVAIRKCESSWNPDAGEHVGLCGGSSKAGMWIWQ